MVNQDVEAKMSSRERRPALGLRCTGLARHADGGASCDSAPAIVACARRLDASFPLDSTYSCPDLSPVPTNVRVLDANEYQFPQLVPFDGIPPVYDPQFASAADAPLLDDELVMGVSLGGAAKAYPVTVLRFREMVDDELAGIPILVTW
jgi:hypothetical protein